MKKSVPGYIIFLASLAILQLLLLTGFRLTLLYLNQEQLTDESIGYLYTALFDRGVLFDLSVTCYTLAPIFLILSVVNFTNARNQNVKKALNLLTFFIIGTVLVLCCSDIPFYKYYNSRLTKTIFTLTENDSISLMLTDLFTNSDYLPFTLAFIFLMIVLWKILKKLGTATNQVNEKKLWKKIVSFLIMGYLIFSGIRGHINPDAKPLKLEHAYISDYTFINQLGLNPVFSFIDSYRAFEIQFMDEKVAIENVQHYLNIIPKYSSPIARKITPKKTEIRANVILVLMESMSANKIGLYGNNKNLTPNLDSIANNSIAFYNVFTAGIHTHNGIYSSLTGLPAVMHNTPMFSAQTSTQTFSGLSNTLDEKGYNSIFFITGKRNFDNMQGFLPKNGYRELISKKDHPKKQWVNRWGIADHHLFDNSISKIDSLAKLPSPFLATYMTVSTHNPYTIPPGIDFKPTTEDIIDRSYQYADWSIGKFMNDVKNKNWFDNTIFIFIGDHGQNFDPIYDVPIAYHHTPMIFYGPKFIQPTKYDKLGLQIDLFPTLMGILQMPYINNTLGINLLEENRPFAYFSADDKLACLNEKYYLIIKKRGKEALYDYKNKSVKNVINEQSELVSEMKKYTHSMLQTTQWMIDNRKIHIPNQ